MTNQDNFEQPEPAISATESELRHRENAHRREKMMAERRIVPLVLAFTIPTMIGMMVNAIYNVVDRFWIGKMEDSALAMAGVGLTLPLTTIAFSFMALVGIGSTALISIRLGEKNHKEAEHVLGNCASLSFLSGLVVMILGLLFARPLLSLFGASDKTMPYALDYVYVLLAFNVINSVQFAMSAVMRGVGHPTWSVTTQVVGAVTNIFLDPLFIFSAGTIRVFGMPINLPFGFGMGVKGAALATGIAQGVSFLIVVYYYLRGKSPVRLHTRNLKPSFPISKKIAGIGSSSFALQCAASFVQIVANIQLAKFGGDMAISAMTLISSISMFCIMPIIGINQGIQPIIGFNYGAKNYRRVRSTYLFAVLMASVITVFFGFFAIFKPENIVTVFSDDPSLVSMSAYALQRMLFFMPLLGFQIISANFFQFIGKSFVALVMTLLRQILLLIPLYFILPIFLGLNGIWLAAPVSDGVAILITTTVITREWARISRLIHEKDALAA